MHQAEHGTALVALLRQRLVTLLDAMPAAQAGDMRSVHQARVATRRLREALPVLGASANHHTLTRLRRQVRRMTRALGPVRELDVALAQLDQLGAQRVVSTPAVSRVRQAVARERLARRRDMLSEISPGKIEKLRQRLGRMQSAPEAQLPAAALEEATFQVTRRARRLAAAVERAGGLYLPARLHRVRIAAKKLRYALEIERELKRSKSTARITQLERLQDLLGRINDFEILIDRTRQVQAELAANDRKMTSELDTLIRTLEAECRADHATYMHRRSGIVKLCGHYVPVDPATSSAVA